LEAKACRRPTTPESSPPAGRVLSSPTDEKAEDMRRDGAEVVYATGEFWHADTGRWIPFAGYLARWPVKGSRN
jgi:hypothetical protein